MLLLQSLNINSISESEWAHLYNIHLKINEKYGFLNLPGHVEIYIKQKKLRYQEGGANQLSIILNGEEIIGIIERWEDYDWGGNPEIKVICNVLFDDIPEECYRLLEDYLKASLDKYNRLTLLSHNSELNQILTSFTWKSQLKEVFWSIKQEDLDRQKLTEWIQEVSANNRGLTLRFFNTVPDELLDQYSELFMDTAEDMPETYEPAFVPFVIDAKKQKERNENFKKAGLIHKWCGVFNEVGKLVAMSNVRYYEQDTRYIYQFMISTTREFRGRKLGRWLYAAMYLKLLSEIPDFELIYLFHHPENVPAYSLSQRTGFQKGYAEDFIILEK